MAEYLITGGAGFIGASLVHHLAAAGRAVRVLDNFLTGRRENLRGLQHRVEIIEGDLRDPAQVRAAVAGTRYVLHVAALPSVPRSIAEPALAHDINLTGTLNLLVAARDARCQRVVFSSSSSVYGDASERPKREQMPPEPLSPYAVQKLTGEHYARIFWKLYGLETVSLRYFNVFGPRQDPASPYAAVIPRFITSILAGRPPTIYGDGKQSRDFTYIDNVVTANMAACVAPPAALGEPINIASGACINLLELAAALNQLTGKQLEPVFEPARPGDILHSQADITRAARLLSWSPHVSFHDGLEQTIQWYEKLA
jgi:nucleoside-diphosphate-sugar epimerase